MYVCVSANVTVFVCVFTPSHTSDQVQCWGNVLLQGLLLKLEISYSCKTQTETEVHSLAIGCC